jgi:hypothetical protein
MHISNKHTIQLYHLYKTYLSIAPVASKIEDFIKQNTCIDFINSIIDINNPTKLDYLTGADIEELGGNSTEYIEFYKLCSYLNGQIVNYYKINSINLPSKLPASPINPNVYDFHEP